MKAIISVIGEDRLGVIAKVSGKLFEMQINIEDISQTIMQNYFTMIMKWQVSLKRSVKKSVWIYAYKAKASLTQCTKSEVKYAVKGRNF